MALRFKRSEAHFERWVAGGVGRMSPEDYRQWKRFHKRRVMWYCLTFVVSGIAITGAMIGFLKHAEVVGYFFLSFLAVGPLAFCLMICIFDSFDLRYREPRVSEARCSLVCDR